MTRAEKIGRDVISRARDWKTIQKSIGQVADGWPGENTVDGLLSVLGEKPEPEKMPEPTQPKPWPKKTAICIGHSRRGDSGAVSVQGISEWDYNLAVAEYLQRLLGNQGEIISNYDASSYGAGVRDCARQVGKMGAEIAIELHFNSASPSAHGFEYLYYDRSASSRQVALAFQNEHARTLPNAKNRGIKPRGAGDRGVGWLRSMPVQSIICEPFFGSNREEWEIYGDAPELVAGIYARAIEIL